MLGSQSIMQAPGSCHRARPASILARPIRLLQCLGLAAVMLLNGCATVRNGSKADPAANPRDTNNQATVTAPAPEAPAPARPQATATARPAASGSGTVGWKDFFDGRTLAGWKITDFAGHGEVTVENGRLLLHSGVMLTGVSYTNELPRIDYEVSLEAMKIDGSDFFCGLTFPVDNAFCSFIAGGWGGGVVGLSSIDGMDASENETTKYMKFDSGRWYPIRLRVTRKRIEVWIDNEKIISQEISGRKISLRPGEIDLSKPFGVATWQTTGALRDIRIRRLAGESAEPINPSPAPLRALFLTGGGSHDYQKLAPHF